MAVGNLVLPKIYPIEGVRLGTTSAGIKKPGRKDLVVIEIDPSATVAAAFTRNAFSAAPVTIAKKHLALQTPRYLLVNTGNANAGTGEQGRADALWVCSQLAQLTDVAVEQILPFSTGVIGEPLPVNKIDSALPSAITNLDRDGWLLAAEGIMTTDTRPKITSKRIEFQGETVTISGIAKGAGMIKPNMATMLGYIATDAAIDREVLQSLVVELSELSFNRITVDGDTSTNDACVLIATGKAKTPLVDAVVMKSNSEFYRLLRDALLQVFVELAQAIIKDAEGATKFVAVKISGANDREEALKVAYAIAESPLVKTALFASDPNWGRILAAVGRAGVNELDVANVKIFLDDLLIAENGGRASSYTEALGKAVMNKEELTISVELTRGEISETVWTCDLSNDYVRINAEYRS